MIGLRAQHTEIEHNSSSTDPTLQLTETDTTDFVRLQFINAVDPDAKWALSAKPIPGSFDNDNLLSEPFIFAKDGQQVFAISADGVVRINKAYFLPNFAGTSGQILKAGPNGAVSWVDNDVIVDEDGDTGVAMSEDSEDQLFFVVDDTIGMLLNNEGLNINGEYTLPNEDGMMDQVLSTDGNGNLSWKELSNEPTDDDGDTKISFDESPAERINFTVEDVVRMRISDNGVLINQAYRLPQLDGGAGQVLTTDGSGVTSWSYISQMEDSDGDSRIEFVETPFEEISFFLSDTLAFRMRENPGGFVRMGGAFNDGNLMMGYQAGFDIGKSGISGDVAKGNLALGINAMFKADSSFRCIALGTDAMRLHTGGRHNIAMGYGAFEILDQGEQNTALGSLSGTQMIEGSLNTFLGFQSAGFLEFGTRNTFIGASAGRSGATDTVQRAICIGFDAGSGKVKSDELYIDVNNTANPLIYGNFATDEVEINGDLDVGELHVGGLIIGTVTLGNKSIESNNVSFNFEDDIWPTDDDAYDLGNTVRRWKTLYTINPVDVSSDRRLKKNIETLDYGIADLMQIRSVEYHLNAQDTNEKKHLGFIAQEMNEIIPEVVGTPDNPDEYMSIKYSELIPVLVNALQDQQEMIDTLTEENKYFKNEIAEIKALLTEVKEKEAE